MYTAKERETLVIETAHPPCLGCFYVHGLLKKAPVDTGCKRKFRRTASCRRADHEKSCKNFRLGQQRSPQRPHSPSGEPSESPRHFAASMDESVIVGYYTSAEVHPQKLPVSQPPLWARKEFYGKRRRYPSYQRKKYETYNTQTEKRATAQRT